MTRASLQRGVTTEVGEAQRLQPLGLEQRTSLAYFRSHTPTLLDGDIAKAIQERATLAECDLVV